MSYIIFTFSARWFLLSSFPERLKKFTQFVFFFLCQAFFRMFCDSIYTHAHTHLYEDRSERKKMREGEQECYCNSRGEQQKILNINYQKLVDVQIFLLTHFVVFIFYKYITKQCTHIYAHTHASC